MKRLVIVLVWLMLVAACGALDRPPASPQPCRQLFNATRCLAMVDKAAIELGTKREDIVALDVLPEPTPEVRDGETILQIRSGGPAIDVRVTLADGSVHLTSMNCGGIAPAHDPACMNDPTLGRGPQGGLEGYRDVPCAGEPPEGCATPLPTIDPDAAGAAEPLRLERVDIPVDRVGDHAVAIGVAAIPNGILSETSYTLVDDWPDDLTMLTGGPWLEVRSLEADGKPFDGYYSHGWRPGAERVQVFLRFHIDRFDPGAVLEIRDVVVR